MAKFFDFSYKSQNQPSDTQSITPISTLLKNETLGFLDSCHVGLIETQRMVPAKFLRIIEGSDGIYEIRIELGSNIYRIFCCFDEGAVVVLFHGIQKMSQKTPPKEIMSRWGLDNL